MAADSEVGQCKQIGSRAESLGSRYRALSQAIIDLKDMERTGEGDNNLNIVSWCEEVLVSLARSINTCPSSLREGVRGLQERQVEFLRQEVALQGLQHGGSQVLATTRQKVERIGNMLPKRLNFLIEKADRLSRLVEGVREGREWVGAAQERLA